MKKIINYEKDILFKTNIKEVCSISLEHDFTVDDGFLRGEFIVSGEYKANELSLNKEEFTYKLPLEYELDKTVDLETFSYDIDNFEYNVKEDELSVYIDLGIRYEEKKQEPIIPTITEDEINDETYFDDIELPKFIEETYTPLREEKEELKPIKEERLKEEEKTMVLESLNEEDTYITYHVHIVREGETLESIATKYNSSIELIKEYNTADTLELKSKLIVPELENE